MQEPHPALLLPLPRPAATVSLGSSRPAFASLLGVYGRGVTQVRPVVCAPLAPCPLHTPFTTPPCCAAQGCGDDGGADVVYATHVDGSLSVWLRMPGGWVSLLRGSKV